jgi:hypothetical protein
MAARVTVRELLAALRAIVAENPGDFVYTIRDNELLGWEGPRVKAWSDAVQVIERYVLEHADEAGA